MKRILLTSVCLLSLTTNLWAQKSDKKAEKPVLKITPGQVIVPFDRMRRIWGELLTLDVETRTGTFRAEHNNEIFHFTAMPYAEMLHHATFGDLSDFTIGERAIFRMHENEQGEWVWLTYIQDEMNMLNGHKEYYFVDKINEQDKSFVVTQAKGDKSFIREEGIIIGTDDKTRFWKKGKPAKFSDVKVGDMLREKSRGTGMDRGRIAWEVFLDEESLLAFQEEQKNVHTKRMTTEGLPGYVDKAEGTDLELTLFQEATVLATELKGGEQVKVAPASVNRKPTKDAITATVVSCTRKGKLFKVTLKTEAPTTDFKVTELARLWVEIK